MLKIGWSKRDVSTDKPVYIPGQFFIRVSKGVMDSITLNCLVIDDGKDIVIFLSGDFVNGRQVLSLIHKKVSSLYPEIPVDKIVFNVTHTHCGVDLYRDKKYTLEPIEGIEISPTKDYIDFFLDNAADAIYEAYSNRKEGYIAYGYGFAVVSHSRRSTYNKDFSLRPEGYGETSSIAIDGHARMYGPTNDDNFIGYEGGADHYTNFMFTFDMDKNLTGAIINVPCPSQNSERESYLTADYWHDVREILYAKYGDIGILPQCAAAGDLSPLPLHYHKAEERRFKLKYGEECKKRTMAARKDSAERICNSFDEVLSWAKKDLVSNIEVAHTVKTIKLDEIPLTDDMFRVATEQLDILLKDGAPALTDNPEENLINQSTYCTQIERFKTLIERYNIQKQRGLLADTEIHVIKIGDIVFATNPFELYIDYQHQIQARSPFAQTFIVQLTDQPENCASASYLATERGMQNLGYSANIYSNRISPAGGAKLVEETLSEINKLYKHSETATFPQTIDLESLF